MKKQVLIILFFFFLLFNNACIFRLYDRPWGLYEFKLKQKFTCSKDKMVDCLNKSEISFELNDLEYGRKEFKIKNLYIDSTLSILYIKFESKSEQSIKIQKVTVVQQRPIKEHKDKVQRSLNELIPILFKGCSP